MATIVHFDISAENVERAEKFYQEMFDWKFISMPGPMNYTLIETKDLNGEKSVGGGMAKRENPEQTGITNFMGVISLDESVKKVMELGGKITQQKQVVPGWGYMAVCMDTENNAFGLFQEDVNAK